MQQLVSVQEVRCLLRKITPLLDEEQPAEGMNTVTGGMDSDATAITKTGIRNVPAISRIVP